MPEKFIIALVVRDRGYENQNGAVEHGENLGGYISFKRIYKYSG
jgi:hypothetical protein